MDYAWYNQIYRNRFEHCLTALINTSVTGDSDYLAIFDNAFLENTAGVVLPTSDSNFIYNNRFISQDATSVTADLIDLTGNDNLVSDNYLACTMAQANNLAPKGANDFWVFNHCTDGEH
jgi:hypothetical protein